MLNRHILQILAFLMVTAASGCGKGDDYKLPQTSAITFINGFTGTGEVLSIQLDRAALPSGLLPYSAQSKYVSVYSGLRELSIAEEGTNAPAKGTIDIKRDTHYSCFITGTGNVADFFMVEDNLTLPDSANSAKMRFVHLNSDFGNARIAFDANVELFDRLPYKSATAFKQVDTLLHSIIVYKEGVADPVIKVDGFKAAAGKIYTLYLLGSEKQTGAKFTSLKTVQHN